MNENNAKIPYSNQCPTAEQNGHNVCNLFQTKTIKTYFTQGKKGTKPDS